MKFLTIILGILTICFLFSTMAIYRLSQDASKAAVASTQKTAIASAIFELENKFEINVLNAISLAQTGFFQPYLGGTPEQRQLNTTAAQSRINNMRNTYSYASLGILDTNGIVIRHTDEQFLGDSFADKSFFSEAMTGKVSVGIPFRYNDMVVYTVASPVYDIRTREIIGVVFNVSSLSDTMGERMYLGSKGYILVADNNGLVLIHNNTANVLTQNINDTSWGQTMLRSKRGDIIFKENGEDKIAYYDTLTETGWLVVAVIDVSDWTAPIIYSEATALFSILYSDVRRYLF